MKEYNNNIVTEKDALKEKLLEKIDQEVDKIKNPEKYKTMKIQSLGFGKKMSRVPSVQPIINLISIDKEKVRKMYEADSEVDLSIPDIDTGKSSDEILQNLK